MSTQAGEGGGGVGKGFQLLPALKTRRVKSSVYLKHVL